jgi:hypothetical protein
MAATAMLFHPGTVDWSGDNPGIYLRRAADEPFCTLAVYFRIALSPHGKGNVMVLFADPARAGGYPEVANLCVADNQRLARYLVASFLTKFGAFRDAAAFSGLTYLPLTGIQEGGDNRRNHVQKISAKGLRVTLEWKKLGAEFAVDLPPEKSATGVHEMYSCFREAGDAAIAVNGRKLPGKPFPRDFHGRPTSSAFLAFSETWVKV